MIKFGPSGTGTLFESENHNTTIEIPEWLVSKGLDCYEYSFGRGVRISKQSASVIGDEFAKHNIEISVHAPYYINMATVEEEKAVNNHRYIKDSIIALKAFGGNRCVFHPGSPLKCDRSESMKTLLKRMEILLQDLYDSDLSDTILAVETMGKLAQLGTVEEVITICKMDKMLYPCIDFGHLNARTCGGIKGYDDYKLILETFIESLGYQKVNDMNLHFSKIQYTNKGEFKHLTFEDEVYGPEFEPLAKALISLNLHPYIICESSGTQTLDAMYMKNYYNSIK